MVDAKDVITVRLLVGYLGEHAQANWWPSRFLEATSDAFVDPVFGPAAGLAQCNGVTEAARKMHDERIGVGRVFHLFRLPETMEQGCFELLQRSPSIHAIKSLLTSREAVMAALHCYGQKDVVVQEGPVRIGSIGDLNREAWLSRAAARYFAAFANGVRSFPYLTDTE
ncbi:MAG: BrxE family protein [Rhodospirillales bacterium]|nr:MAG: BrxE family protein [Rhodospirillales bacterium]